MRGTVNSTSFPTSYCRLDCLAIVNEFMSLVASFQNNVSIVVNYLICSTTLGILSRFKRAFSQLFVSRAQSEFHYCCNTETMKKYFNKNPFQDSFSQIRLLKFFLIGIFPFFSINFSVFCNHLVLQSRTPTDNYNFNMNLF